MLLLHRPLFILWLFLTGCSLQNASPEADFVAVDRDQLLEDLEYLSSDLLEGRAPGTEGNERARRHIIQRFRALELKPFGESYRHPFTLADGTEAVNIIGYVEGSENPDQFLTVTAHFDHLGVVGEEIYNGADDNASGTSGLLAAARWFAHRPPENSVLFIAFDAEEQGLAGSSHFVGEPVVPLGQIPLVVNMDMISVSEANELFAVGTYHYDFLKPRVEESTQDSPVTVRFGYDSPEWDQDWTLQSDQGPFHLHGVPFIYFGVEDHEYYHRPSDTFENIHPDFFVNSVTTILTFLRDIDGRLDDVREASGR